MKRFFGVVQISVILVILVVAALFATQWTNDEDEDSAPPISASQFGQTQSMLVEVVRPTKIESSVEIETTGTISYRTTIDVVPQVQGRVVWVSQNMRPGGSFEKDAVVFRLDKADAKLGLRQAKAEMHSAYADLRLTEAERDAAVHNYRLLHGDQPVPQLVAKEPQLARANAAIERATTRVLQAELDLARTEFSFPFDGNVLASSVSVGQLLRVGQSVGKVYDSRDIEAVFPVSSIDMASLDPVIGRTVIINLPRRKVEAVIERKSSELDSRTRTTQLYARFRERKGELIPGQFIEATIYGPTLTDVFILPEAVEQANQTVWVVQENQLKRKPITVINRRSDGLLLSAFDSYEGVVKGALPNAKDGDLVQVISESNS